MLKLYNSLTQEKEEFVPLNKDRVTMYVCGVTPYDTTHLGHAFTYISFDVLYRYLKYKNYNVVYTQNVTDIDDDILKKAKEVKKNWIDLGTFWTDHFLNDMKNLNYLPPTFYVKATESIDEMIKIIKTLIERELAYEKDGNVYFKVSKFQKYGELSKISEALMIRFLKERGGNPNDPLKKGPLDFLLWQSAKPDEPSWDSPWSKGRPGWHIECTAMIKKYLGEQIDIHGGGTDLKFPHHDSEIAQGESYSGKAPYVKYWMHTGTVLMQGEKMAKSLGNLVMVSNLLKKYSANTIKFTLLTHHYRSPWDFNEKEFIENQEVIDKIEDVLKQGDEGEPDLREFEKCMDDDLDIPCVLCGIKETILRKEPIPNLKRLFSILGFQL